MGVFALGWRGSARQWHVYERAYLLLAALATPLVLSVHSVVSFDFAVSQLPGWHATIFPPYFVAGAIFSGFAMVVTLMVPARAYFGLKDAGHDPPPGQHEPASSWPPASWSAYAYGDRGVHGLVQRQPVRVRSPYSIARWGRMAGPTGLMVALQRARAAVVLVARSWRTTPWMMMIVACAGQRGHVDGAVRDHRRLAEPRFSAVELGDVQADRVDIMMLAGSFGLFFTLFLLVLPLPADGGHGGGQRRALPFGQSGVRESGVEAIHDLASGELMKR